MFKYHNSSKIKYQVATTNSFILTFLQRFECSCTQFQAIIYSVNPQKTYTFIKIKTPWKGIIWLDNIYNYHLYSIIFCLIFYLYKRVLFCVFTENMTAWKWLRLHSKCCRNVKIDGFVVTTRYFISPELWYSELPKFGKKLILFF